MGDIAVTGRTKVWLLDSLSDVTAPSVSEINAGTAIHPKLMAIEGFTPSATEFSTAKVNDEVDAKAPGSLAYSNAAFVVANDDTDDSIVEALEAAELATKYVVIGLRTPAATAVAAGQVVSVYTVIVGYAHDVDPGQRDSIVRTRVPMMIQSHERNVDVVA